jgi:hypothetical protein
MWGLNGAALTTSLVIALRTTVIWLYARNKLRTAAN